MLIVELIGVSGSRDVSGLCFDFGRHVPPDVSTLSFKLKAETLTSGPPPSICCCCEKMATVQCVPRIYTTRFRLKNVERFMFIKFFDDTTMFLHGQSISSISTDTLDTDEIFMINVCNHAQVSCLSRHARTKKLTESE